MSAATMNEMERLRRERDEARADSAALAAHVERLREAGEQAVNGFSLNGLGDTYEAEDLLAALREAPKISRTKLKAQWQADLLEEYREDLGCAGVAFVDCLARKLRRQAEEGT